jgi:ferredoxin-NADP reductase/DMSO/TMAO reductase YedYZ heme-binding membrane subunit
MRSVTAGGALAVIGAGAAAVLALWWHGTPAVGGFGDWLVNAGRLTGLAAGYGVAVLIALMARLPPLERGVGADRLARWHAAGGRYVVSLVAGHALLITWGYAVTAHAGVPGQAWTLLDSYPDVLLASVAGLLLVATGVVSARAARRRLRYETWYYLHLYTYLAAGLAFAHQFADGAQFMTDTAARVAWSALYVAVGAAVAWYRFLTPARQALRHRLRVTAVKPEAPGVVSVLIGGRDLAGLRAEPGQFFRWRFLAPGLWWTASPYSLSAPPRPDRLRITVKASGGHSDALAGLQPGTRVVSEGPYGALTAAARRRRQVLLIAGGTGITPLRALLESLPAGPGELTLIYRVSSLRDAVFRAELERLAARREARAWFVAGQRDALAGDPLSAAELTRRVPGLAAHDVYLCGPPGLADTVTRELRAAGVSRRRIHRESFDLQEPKGNPLRRVILAVCATAAGLVLLLSFKTHPLSTPPGAGSAGDGTSAVPASPAPVASGPARTVTGAPWPTIYGPVQVRVTVRGGRVTAASAVVYPVGTPRDQQINAFAIPRLNAEAVSAGSARIDTVSGATYTSQGYEGSLQSALDKARG